VDAITIVRQLVICLIKSRTAYKCECQISPKAREFAYRFLIQIEWVKAISNTRSNGYEYTACNSLLSRMWFLIKRDPGFPWSLMPFGGL